MIKHRITAGMSKNRGDYGARLVLFSAVLPLLTGLLYGQEQPKQHDDHQVAAGRVLGSSGEAKQNSTEARGPAANAQGSDPDLATTLVRMSEAAVINTSHRRPYTVTREYDLIRRRENKPSASVVADVTFRPPILRTYRILQAQGNIIGKEVVHHVLDGETDMVKNHRQTDITEQNYDFALLDKEVSHGHECYRLKLLPKRKDKNLLNGTILLDANTYLIRRIDGDPQKSPSWWVKNVHVLFVFGDVGGMWQPTSTAFTADVRLIGNWTMYVHDLAYSFPPSTIGGKTETQQAPADERARDYSGRGIEGVER